MLRKLPPAARHAVRLASRAARDAVDARCTALSVREPGALLDALAPLPGLAPRLRSLSRIKLGAWTVENDPSAAKAHCAALAGALERLPSPAALTALEIVLPSSLPDAAPLVAALGRCTGLRSLRAAFVASEPRATTNAIVAELLRAAAAKLPALASLHLLATGNPLLATQPAYWLCRTLPEALPQADALLPLWRRLEALELRQAAVTLLPLLASAAGGGVAPQLSRLRSLEADLTFCLRSAGGVMAGVFAAPWAPQLTKLECIGVDTQALRPLVAWLPTGAETPLPLLAAVRDFEIEFDAGQGGAVHMLPAAGEAPPTPRLLGAVNLGTIEALSINGVERGAAAAVAARAAEMPNLRALDVFGPDQLDSAGRWDIRDAALAPAAWGALRDAPFAPLTRLYAAAAGWLLAAPERLNALLSAPWAASLVDVTLGNDNGPMTYVAAAGALAPLSRLPALQKLKLLGLGPSMAHAPAIRGAPPPWLGEEPASCGWARRLVDLEVVEFNAMPPATLLALAALPFERLERLRVGTLYNPSAPELRAFAAAGAAWLPRLGALELGFDPRSDRPLAEARRAALDVDGPLRALHRGGGEVLVKGL